ncbi:NhaA family Na+:H+ antiporter [Bosea sp. AK1]|uniref:Na+/H+ antiporter NhaA n=1 Tax=Bosea sp. AK1 TaxID=2587160 RepID=UPI00114F7BDE|nr:Na+/H+ antiporter NhaA [Bosea sp. AK1]TQI75523.1 NhaA family Na+:H+ antiporter [Bosea sp. AK1]
MAAPATRTKPLSALRDFLHGEAAGGIVLMVVAALALVVANSPAAPLYFGVLKSYVLGLSILHWINDALMAVFFLLVGLEIKREMLDGQLSSWSRRVLPGFAALGGMVAPALIYVAFNLGAPESLRGWAIPTATDIAFALGVLSLLGSRVPASLKVFLTALAILDDLGAVIIIAVFYTAGLSGLHLGLAAATLAALIALNRLGVMRLAPYLLLGLALWYFTLKSGVHATLAGVALALTIPLTPSPAKPDSTVSPLHRLEHGLHPWVAFLVIPVFGFANAGVSFAGLGLSTLAAPVPFGIMLGLFLGKQIGVFGFSWLAIRTGFADLPARASWAQFYGIALLCGIGFTMSLFIGLLAFPDSEALQSQTKIGVIAGSLLSGICGWLLLRLARPEDMRESKG